MDNKRPEKVIIAIGDESPWCRALALKNDMPAGTSGKLKVQSLKSSLGEYLIMLLMQGYFLQMDKSELGHMITAHHKDYMIAKSDEMLNELIAEKMLGDEVG
jgi:hypothetical protein